MRVSPDGGAARACAKTMRIAEHRIVDPERNAAFVVPALVVSLFVFAYSVRFGQVSILAFYACWIPPFLVAPHLLLLRPLPVLLLLSVPFVFTLSTLWSDTPGTTLRSGLQYGTTIFCAVVAARITSMRSLALGGTLGSLVVLLYSVANGGYSYDIIDGTYAFNGAFASKNQLGFFATLALIFAFTLVWYRRRDRLLVPLAMAVAALAVVMLWMSDSATSLLATGAAFAAIAVVRLLLALAPRLRLAAVLLVLSATVAFTIAAWRLGAFDAVLAAFGKDTSLTGRTYLWSQAIEIGGEHPVFGLGYEAFWTHGRDAAERLWEEFYITARTGFHFHNLLMETYVGMGLLGVSMVGTVCLLLFAMPIRAVLGRGEAGAVMACTGFCILFLVRTMVEVDFIMPYTAGSFLVAFVLLHLADQGLGAPRAVRAPRHTPSASGWTAEALA